MKVEVVSIGNELLMGDVLDTNAAHITRCLDEINAGISCKVTVGDDTATITDALDIGLRRADVVITTGGLGMNADDHTRDALAELTGRPLLHSPAGIDGATILGSPGQPAHGLAVQWGNGTIIALPGSHRFMAYLMETEVLPLLQQYMQRDGASGWILLRTAGLMESTLAQQLSHIPLKEGQRLTYASFAGQTDIRLWNTAATPEAFRKGIEELATAVTEQLGDYVYGRDAERLENAVFRDLMQHKLRVATAECHTGQTLMKTLKTVANVQNCVYFAPVSTQVGLAAFLNLEPLALNSDLTRWCRLAAERLRTQSHADLGLILYNNVTRSGVQILVTLASHAGVSVMQRSFGGHPGNISQWASTLALVHLRRWLLTHHPEAQ